MINKLISLNELEVIVKKMLDDSGVNTRLVDNCSTWYKVYKDVLFNTRRVDDCTRWHKVYKDVLFNESMFYRDRETFAMSLLKEPYIMVSMYKDVDKQNSFVMFFLDSVTIYPKDMKQVEKTVKQLSEQYKKCCEAYLTIREDIDRANKSIVETSKKVEFKEFVKHVNQVERQLNSQLQEIWKINEIM